MQLYILKYKNLPGFVRPELNPGMRKLLQRASKTYWLAQNISARKELVFKSLSAFMMTSPKNKREVFHWSKKIYHLSDMHRLRAVPFRLAEKLFAALDHYFNEDTVWFVSAIANGRTSPMCWWKQIRKPLLPKNSWTRPVLPQLRQPRPEWKYDFQETYLADLRR